MSEFKPEIEIKNYPKIPTFVLLLFCAYVIIWYLQIGLRKPSLGEIRIEYLWAIILSIIAIVYTDLECYKNPLMRYLILYFFLLIIQVVFSYNLQYSWKIFVDRIVKFAFMAWFIIVFVRSPKGLLFFLSAFLLACMKMGQEGFIGQVTGNLVWENQGIMRLHGSTPLYRHPNSFSGMAVGTLPFVLSFFSIANKYVKAFLILLLIFSANIIIFTGSRTGYVATIFLFLYFFLKRPQKKMKPIIIFILIALIGIHFIPDNYKDRFVSIFTLEEKEGRSSLTRIQILEDAIEIFLENPLGVGVSAFPFIREDMFGRSQDTHNLYLEIATNLGIPGLIIFAMIIYKIISMCNMIINRTTAFKEKYKNKEISQKFLFQINLVEKCSLAVILFIVARLGLGLFGMDLYEIYWWFASGLAIALHNISKSMNLNILE